MLESKCLLLSSKLYSHNYLKPTDSPQALTSYSANIWCMAQSWPISGVGGAMMAMLVLSQLRAPLSLQTAWTGFNPYIVVGHPQHAPLWWKIAAARSFILNRGIVTDTMSSHAPGARMVCSEFHSTKAVVSQVIRSVLSSC